MFTTFLTHINNNIIKTNFLIAQSYEHFRTDYKTFDFGLCEFQLDMNQKNK